MWRKMKKKDTVASQVNCVWIYLTTFQSDLKSRESFFFFFFFKADAKQESD